MDAMVEVWGAMRWTSILPHFTAIEKQEEVERSAGVSILNGNVATGGFRCTASDARFIN
jgi:hypothetical protein